MLNLELVAGIPEQKVLDADPDDEDGAKACQDLASTVKTTRCVAICKRNDQQTDHTQNSGHCNLELPRFPATPSLKTHQ